MFPQTPRAWLREVNGRLFLYRTDVLPNPSIPSSILTVSLSSPLQRPRVPLHRPLQDLPSKRRHHRLQQSDPRRMSILCRVVASCNLHQKKVKLGPRSARRTLPFRLPWITSIAPLRYQLRLPKPRTRPPLFPFLSGAHYKHVRMKSLIGVGRARRESHPPNSAIRRGCNKGSLPNLSTRNSKTIAQA